MPFEPADCFDPVQLHLAQSNPSEWGRLVLELAQRHPELARREAEKVRIHEIDCGHRNSDLCRTATGAITGIAAMTGIWHAPGGPVRSSRSFYQAWRPA